MPENPTLECYPDRALLTPYNDDSTSLNDAVLDRLPGRVLLELKSEDSVAREPGNNNAILCRLRAATALPELESRLHRHVVFATSAKDEVCAMVLASSLRTSAACTCKAPSSRALSRAPVSASPHLAFPDGLPTPVQTPPSSVSVMGSCTLPSPVAGSHQMTAMGFVA